MSKLRLGAIADDKPVKMTVELPAQVARDLRAYAEILAQDSGQPVEPEKLVAPMLARFMATDRGFAQAKRSRKDGAGLDNQRLRTRPPETPVGLSRDSQ